MRHLIYFSILLLLALPVSGLTQSEAQAALNEAFQEAGTAHRIDPPQQQRLSLEEIPGVKGRFARMLVKKLKKRPNKPHVSRGVLLTLAIVCLLAAVGLALISLFGPGGIVGWIGVGLLGATAVILFLGYLDVIYMGTGY